MALRKSAQTSNSTREWDATPISRYDFSESNLALWKKFWNEMGGNQQAIVEWATGLGMESPQEWYLSLCKYLFSCMSDPTAFRTVVVAKKLDFGAYLGQLIQQHLESPFDDEWYLNKCMTRQQFITALQRAVEMDKHSDIVSYFNSLSFGLGFLLLEEYALSQVQWKEQAKKVASHLNKQAYDLEKKAGVKDFCEGQKVVHQLYPDMELEVLQSMDGGVLAAPTAGGILTWVEDPWNLTLIK